MNSFDFLNLIMDEVQLNRFVEESEWDASVETDIVDVNWNDDYDTFWTNYIKDSADHARLEGVLDNKLDIILTNIYEIENLNIFEQIIDSSYNAFYETYNMPPCLQYVIGG